MTKTTLTFRIAKKSGKTIAEITIDGKNRILDNFDRTGYDFDMDYPVEYREDHIDQRANNTRLLVFYQGKQIFDSRPELARYVKPIPKPEPETGKETPKVPEKTGRKDHTKMTDGHIEHVSSNRAARAPYNFVPLNTETFEFSRKGNIPDFDRYHSDRFTGWVDLNIETITPLYIRDTLNLAEAKEDEKARESNRKYDNPNFFSPSGKPQIPGSSLRGMVRTLVEIISYSKFQFFDKKTLYFRGLADQSNLRHYYNDRMTDESLQGIAKYKINAGYLQKQGFQYSIIPAQVRENGKQFQRFQGRHNLDHYEFTELNSGNYIIRSGRKVNPRQRDKDVWEIFKPVENPTQEDIVKLHEPDVYDYNNDNTRGAKINLIEKCKYNKLVPCFYVVNMEGDKQKSIAIGHTALFRIAYRKSIDNLIRKIDRHATKTKEEKEIEKKNQSDKVDIAEALFGKLDEDNYFNFAGRLFFEDAVLTEGQENVLMSIDNPKVLSGPKPTTFQHYLVQKSDNNSQLNHYDENTQIRGYKLYWHKSGKNWAQTDKIAVKKFHTQYTTIQSVRPNVRFDTKIRFENLSNVELGALLYALDLPQGCCHKLGMGKPLGLGSIKITPTLYISNRDADNSKSRYRKLFSEWMDQPEATNNVEKYKMIFSDSVTSEIFGKVLESLWLSPRLQELKVMLDYQKGVELERKQQTRYMEILGENEFKFRRVLPTAMQVAGVKTEDTSQKKANKLPDLVFSYFDKGKTNHKQRKETLKSPFTRNKITHIKSISFEGMWGKEKINGNWENLDKEVNILLGLNGSGKTTLLRLLKQVLNNKAELSGYPPPRTLTVGCDNNTIIQYVNGIKQTPIELDIQTVYVSTFDIETSISGSKPEKGERKVNDYIDEQVTASLVKLIGDFNSYIFENRNSEVSAHKKQKLSDHVATLFSRTGKKIEFHSSFKLEREALYAGPNETPARPLFPELIMLALFELIDMNIEWPEKEFFKTLENKVGINTLNQYRSSIQQCGKKSDIEYLIFREKDGNWLPTEKLSSGEKQILIILLKVLIQADTTTILLMDEPEISLHLEWQDLLIKILHEINPNMQMIIATHSPGIMLDGLEDRVVGMSQIVKGESQ